MAFPPAQKHLFYTELAKLVEAGFGIRDAGRAMLDTRPPATQAALLRAMDARLEAGQSIAEAFGADQPEISDLERRILAAGERGGRLGPAFQHLADYFGMLATARRDFRQSMVYPLVLLHLGVFVAIVPSALMGGERDFGSIARGFIVALLALYALGGLVVFVLRGILKAAPENAAIDRLLHRLPVIGRARRAMAMARFTKVYHIGLLAGLSMRETVEAASLASQSGILREAGRRLMDALKDGGALGPEFVKCGAFPPAFARSYATAEEAGGLDKDLARWAKVFHEDAARGAKAVSVVIPKLLYVVVVGFVLWKVLAFYSGYYGAMEKFLEE
jgi:type II secretory pathway component PulF